MCVYPFIILVFCMFISGVLGPCEFLWRAGSYIFCVCLRCVECRAGTSLFGHFPGVDGGTVRVFFFSVSVVAGTVRLKWWGGVFRLSFHFLQFAVSSPGVRLSVVGFCSFIFVFLGCILVFARFRTL